MVAPSVNPLVIILVNIITVFIIANIIIIAGINIIASITIVIIMIPLIELMVAPSVNPLVQKLPWNAVPRPPICNIPSSSPISFIIIIFVINVTRPKQ